MQTTLSPAPSDAVGFPPAAPLTADLASPNAPANPGGFAAVLAGAASPGARRAAADTACASLPPSSAGTAAPAAPSPDSTEPTDGEASPTALADGSPADPNDASAPEAGVVASVGDLQSLLASMFVAPVVTVTPIAGGPAATPSGGVETGSPSHPPTTSAGGAAPAGDACPSSPAVVIASLLPAGAGAVQTAGAAWVASATAPAPSAPDATAAAGEADPVSPLAIGTDLTSEGPGTPARAAGQPLPADLLRVTLRPLPLADAMTALRIPTSPLNGQTAAKAPGGQQTQAAAPATADAKPVDGQPLAAALVPVPTAKGAEAPNNDGAGSSATNTPDDTTAKGGGAFDPNGGGSGEPGSRQPDPASQAGRIQISGATVLSNAARAYGAPAGMRAEKIAGGPAINAGTSGDVNASSSKSALDAKGQVDAKGSPLLGIDGAKSAAAMSTALPPTRNPAAETAVAGGQPVAARAEEATLPAEVSLPSTAHRAVEAALSAVDRFASRDQHSVSLQFSVAGADLRVRVEMRAGEVHATFRTDNPELRAALSAEWQSVTSQGAAERTTKLAPPVFTTSDSYSGSASGEGSARQRDTEPRAATPSYSSAAGRPGSSKPAAATPVTPSAPTVASPRSVHLHTLA